MCVHCVDNINPFLLMLTAPVQVDAFLIFLGAFFLFFIFLMLVLIFEPRKL